MKKIISSCLLATILFFNYQSSFAKVKLSAFFTDHMIFQQQTKTAIWGWASAGQTIRINTSWNQKEYKTNVDKDGKWSVTISTPKYGGPYQVDISDGDLTVLKNVLIGEIWFCAGQSNMEMPLAGWGKITNYQEEIAAADFPNIRLLQVIHQSGKLPVNDVKVTNNGWTTCNSTTIADFSATAYFFAREVYKKTGIPIGLIHSSWGGTVAEAWISGSTLKKNVDFAAEVENLEKAGIAEAGSPQPNTNVNKPTLLYNTMVYPFHQFAIKGVIWYQGESNAARANQYRELFPSLITDWRSKWNIGDFPFYFVQLANFKAKLKEPRESDWAELRDAQKGALKLANTGMAVTIDIGDEKDIHPKNKQDVGKRLAYIALAKTYHKDVVFDGPIMNKISISGGLVKIYFKNTTGGLVVKNGTLKGFAIAGADGKFYNADGKLEGNHVTLAAKEVKTPIAVRYAWANNPDASLFNAEGLPARPFKTDQFKDSTKKK